MKHFRSSLAFAAALVLLLGAAIAPAAAQTNEPPKPNDVSVFQQGDKFIVVVSKTDGSATMAVVEAKDVKMDGAEKGKSKPDIADLMKKGRVTYTVQVAPNGTPAAQAIEQAMSDLPQGKPGDTAAKKVAKAKSAAKLTRKQKADLVKRIKLSAQALDTIGKGLAKGAESASDTPKQPDNDSVNSSAAGKR